MSDIIVRETSLIQQAKDDWGMVAQSSQSLAIRCMVGQPSNKTKLKIGEFNFSNPEWPPTPVIKNVVIVSPHKTRVLYGKEFTDKRRCGSDNYAVPSPFIEKPISNNCFECALGKWDSNLSEEQKEFKHVWQTNLGKDVGPKPLCTDTINLIVVDDRLIPFSLKFQKTQLKVVQEQLINRIRFKGKRPYQVMFDMSLKQPEGDSYFDYVFDNFRDVDDEQKYLEIFTFFKENGERILAEQISEIDGEKDVTTPF